MPSLPNWRSFWDLAPPLKAASALIDMYGEAAATAAANCAIAARADCRDADYRFWIAVLGLVQAAEQLAGDAE